MRFHRSLRRLTLLTAMLAIASYAVAAGSAGVALIGLPAALGAWWAGARPQARFVPRIVMNVAMLLVIVFAGAISFAGPSFGVETVANLIVALTVGKLFDWRSSRDAAQVLTLSVFLGVAAALTSLQLAMALLLAILTPMIILSAMVYQVCAGQELAQEESGRLAPASGPGAAVGMFAGAGAASHLRRLAGASLVAILAIAVVVFILTPRGVVPGTFGGLEGPDVGSRVDFTSTVRLGRGGLLSESQRVVMDMQVTDGSGQPVGGPDRIFYLRGAALGSYRNGVWTRSEASVDSDASIRRAPQTPLMVGGQSERGPILVQRFTLRNAGEGRPYLFAVQQPFRWEFDEAVRIVSNSHDRVVRITDPRPQFSYTVHSALHSTSPMAASARANQEEVLYDPVEQGLSSQVITDITASVLQEAGLDPAIRPRTTSETAAIVHAIRDYLSGNYSYTLDIQRAEGEPIEWFLTEGRSGHCEYFASAMAAMCRSVGIDARVITGFVAAEYNDASRTYTIRESNAHAWVEVDHGGNQWRPHDPSPAVDVQRIHKPEPTLLARLRRWSDAIEHLWVTSFVSYDASSRDRLLGASSERRGGSQLPMLGALEERLSQLRSGGWSGLGRAAMVGMGVFGVVFLLLFAGARVLRRFPLRLPWRGGASDGPQPPEPGLYRDLLMALQLAGAPKPAWRPLLAHTRELADTAPQVAAAAGAVADLYYRSRFGAHTLTEPEVASARERLEAMLDTVREESAAPSPDRPSPARPTV